MKKIYFLIIVITVCIIAGQNRHGYEYVQKEPAASEAYTVNTGETYIVSPEETNAVSTEEMYTVNAEESYIAEQQSQRKISCWGDSMMEVYGSSEAYVMTNSGTVDISYYTAPMALEALTGLKTYNFGVSGETSEEIAVRAGGITLYTDRNIYISSKKSTTAVLVDGSGQAVMMSDFSGYGSEDNDMPDTCYINGRLCRVTQVRNSQRVRIQLCDEGDGSGYMFVPKGTAVIPKAAVGHSDDIMILEMGSNGGWYGDYSLLVEQYRQIIDNSGCTDYIIVGDTDNPGESLADVMQTQYNSDGTYVGTGDTMWEAALREAFGEHFLNMRVYMLENGLADCGLEQAPSDAAAYEMGYIPEQLRSDWTHFNSYGYYAKGMGIYLKGVELGYWQ